MKKFCRIFASIVTVLLLPSCVADSKHQLKVKTDVSKPQKTDISKPQWKEENGGAALPLAAAMDFCIKEASGESAKIAAVVFLDKKYAAGSIARVLDSDSLDAVKASEMSKCMIGLGYERNRL
jgi:hypothetical protein